MSEEDKDLISSLGDIPKPSEALDYDYMQLNRLLPIEKLKELEEAKIFTSEYTKLMTTKVTGDMQNLLMMIHWGEEEVN